jgi:hypothetical protein
MAGYCYQPLGAQYTQLGTWFAILLADWALADWSASGLRTSRTTHKGISGLTICSVIPGPYSEIMVFLFTTLICLFCSPKMTMTTIKMYAILKFTKNFKFFMSTFSLKL